MRKRGINRASVIYQLVTILQNEYYSIISNSLLMFEITTEFVSLLSCELVEQANFDV